VDDLWRDLAAYYDQEADIRAGRRIAPERLARRDEFLSLLLAEGRRAVLEVGTGPGRDATAFLAAGLRVAGVDLSSEHVRRARQAGVDAHQASVLDLPFPPRCFDAGWTMSTLVHVPDSQFDVAVRAIADRLVDGALLAVGLWGGTDHEGVNEDDTIEPKRFFSRRSDQRARAMLGTVGEVERFDTWGHREPEDLHYQWALIRVRHR
jgi:SAM-dependent methyltransferase